MNEVIVVEVKPQMVLGMRKRGKYEEIGAMLAKVYQFAVPKGIQIQGPPILVCHEGRQGGKRRYRGCRACFRKSRRQ